MSVGNLDNLVTEANFKHDCSRRHGEMNRPPAPFTTAFVKSTPGIDTNAVYVDSH